jgi:hypothetical protein
MSLFRKESAWDKVAKPLARVPGRSVAKSGLTAGAAVVAVSALSAATSALRRRAERS